MVRVSDRVMNRFELRLCLWQTLAAVGLPALSYGGFWLCWIEL